MECQPSTAFRLAAVIAVAALLTAAGPAHAVSYVHTVIDDFSVPDDSATDWGSQLPLEGWVRNELTGNQPIDGGEFAVLGQAALIYNAGTPVDLSGYDAFYFSVRDLYPASEIALVLSYSVGLYGVLYPVEGTGTVYLAMDDLWYGPGVDRTALAAIDIFDLFLWSWPYDGPTGSAALLEWGVATLQSDDGAVIPVPPAAGLILLGMAGVALRRRLCAKQARAG